MDDEAAAKPDVIESELPAVKEPVLAEPPEMAVPDNTEADEALRAHKKALRANEK